MADDILLYWIGIDGVLGEEMKSTANIIFGLYSPFDPEELSPRHKKWNQKQIALEPKPTEANTYVISPYWKMNNQLAKKEVPEFNEVGVEDVIIFQKGIVFTKERTISR